VSGAVSTAPSPIPDRPSGARWQGYKWAVSLLTATLGTALYNVIGRLDIERSKTLLMTPPDRAIPLVPWTAWLYEPFYVGIFAIATIGISSRRLFHRALACIVGNQIVASVLHLAIQAEYPRPTLPDPAPDLSTAFLAFVYRIDPPANVFPSLHVAHTFVVAFILLRDRPALGRLAVAMAVVLALSTLTTKQHFIADLVAGFAMALVGRALALRAQ
jgi:hypothetical protein